MMKDLQLHSVDDMSMMANAIAKSGLFGMKTADQALALMIVAQAQGKHPATITDDYDIIQGRACRKSSSLLTQFQAMGGTVQWDQDNHESRQGATFSHPSGGSMHVAWDIERATKAGLTGKDNWKKYPQQMMRARCISEGVRAVYPAAIGGMLVSEEAQDMPKAEIDMGAAQMVPETATKAEKIKAELAAKAGPGPVISIDHETGEMFDPPTYDETMAALGNCKSPEMLDELRDQCRTLYLDLSKGQRAAMTKSINALELEYDRASSDA